MDIEKHLREKERLNQALHDRLSDAQAELKEFFKKYKIDATLGIAHDVSCFVIEELYIEQFNLPEY